MRSQRELRLRNGWINCNRRNCDFSCLPPATQAWDADGITEDQVSEWAKVHSLRHDCPGQVVYCNHGGEWVAKELVTKENGDLSWYCGQRSCRGYLPYDGPLVDAWGLSGFKDVINVVNAWIERKSIDETIELTKLTKNTILKKFATIEKILATHMRYHELMLSAHIPGNHYFVRHAHPERAHDPVVVGVADNEDLAATAENQDDVEVPIAIDHVETDEVHFGHRKYESGARVAAAGQHIFQTMVAVNINGRICDFVMRPIADKSGATLQSFIRANVPARTVVATDCWKGYIGLNADYIHTTVNHSDKRNKFVNPVNGTTTNCVEFMHRLIKAQMAKRGSRLGQSSSQRIARVMAHGVLAVGSLSEVDGNRRRYIFQCLREVIAGGWPLWEAIAESERDDSDAQGQSPTTRGRRLEQAESPVARQPARDPALLTIGWPRDQPLPPGAVILQDTFVQAPEQQDPAAGTPRTALFARNLAAAAARSASQSVGRGRGRGRPPGRGRGARPPTQEE